MKNRRELRYFEMPSRLGRLLAILTERGLVRIAFDVNAHDEVERLAQRLRLDSPPARVHSEPLEDELCQYLKGTRTDFSIPLDLALTSPFGHQVLALLVQMRPGQITTYGELARRLGRPQAARAVGRAVGANPIPIVIPCHRVLAADGSLGGYSGGLERKRELLALEGLPVPQGGWPPRRHGRTRSFQGGPKSQAL